MTSFVKAIHLHGDSIFDNVSYVDSGNDECSVIEHLNDLIVPPTKAILYAVDGDTTRGTKDILGKMNAFSDDTYAVLSCGGNDALQASPILMVPANSVYDALSTMNPIVNEFGKNYESLLWELTNTYQKKNVRVCTVYNQIPIDGHSITEEVLLALRMFNDVITELANQYGIELIDLRNICDEYADYSPMSPIEPSHQGGEKIAKAIVKSFSMKTVNCKPTSC